MSRLSSLPLLLSLVCGVDTLVAASGAAHGNAFAARLLPQPIEANGPAVVPTSFTVHTEAAGDEPTLASPGGAYLKVLLEPLDGGPNVAVSPSTLADVTHVDLRADLPDLDVPWRAEVYVNCPGCVGPNNVRPPGVFLGSEPTPWTRFGRQGATQVAVRVDALANGTPVLRADVTRRSDDFDPATLGPVFVAFLDAATGEILSEAVLTPTAHRQAWTTGPLSVFSSDPTVPADAEGFSYQQTVYWHNATGHVVASRSDTVRFVDDDDDGDSVPTVALVRTRKDRLGRAEVVSYTRDEDALPLTVHTTLIDTATGTTLLDEVTEASSRLERHFTTPVYFKGDPADGLYRVQLQPRDDAGNPSGPARIVRLPARTYTLDDTVMDVGYMVNGEGMAALFPSEDAEAWTLQVWLQAAYAEQTAYVDATFAPPLSGPPAKAATFPAELSAQWREWVQTASQPSAGPVQARVGLAAPNGTSFDAVTATADQGLAYTSGDSPLDVDVFIQALAAGGGTSSTPRHHIRHTVRR